MAQNELRLHNRTAVRDNGGEVALTRDEVRELLEYAGGEVFDDEGNPIGYVEAPARIKINAEHLGHGGFLEVYREEETGLYVANEWDALIDKRRTYPGGGVLRRVWTARTLEEAVDKVMEYFPEEQ